MLDTSDFYGVPDSTQGNSLSTGDTHWQLQGLLNDTGGAQYSVGDIDRQPSVVDSVWGGEGKAHVDE